MDPISDSVRLLIDAWTLMVRRLPAGEVTRGDGVVSALGNVELPFLNLCVQDGPMVDLDDVRRRLRVADERTADCPHPRMFALCEDWAPEGWERAVEEYGLVVAMTITGMTADALLPPRRPLPALDLRPVDEKARARTVAELNMDAYELPRAMAASISDMHLWTGPGHAFLGVVDDRPVTCAAAFPVDDTVYVALVATAPDEHRKGYAEAVMRHVITRGSTEWGSAKTTLHASDAGRPLYEAMGYRKTATFRLLAEPME